MTYHKVSKREHSGKKKKKRRYMRSNIKEPGWETKATRKRREEGDSKGRDREKLAPTPQNKTGDVACGMTPGRGMLR